jgi:hypothetical protein
MRNPEAVLHEKEMDLVRVRREVEALRTAVLLLDDPLGPVTRPAQPNPEDEDEWQR